MPTSTCFQLTQLPIEVAIAAGTVQQSYAYVTATPTALQFTVYADNNCTSNPNPFPASYGCQSVEGLSGRNLFVWSLLSIN